MSYITFPTVQTIINGVSQDIRNQLSATASPGLSILVDYTNRVHKQILRFSRWNFLLSEPQYFITQYGQGTYWIGPKGSGVPGSVETSLNLQDVDKIKKDSVVDLSNLTSLKWLSTQSSGALSINLLDRSGIGRPQLPKTFVQNPNDPNVLLLYPPPNNENETQPTPQVPIVQTVAGGAQAARTYLVKITFVDSLGGESTGPTTGAPIYISANNLALVKSPSNGVWGVLPYDFSVSGVQYGWYNVYAQLTVPLNGQITNDGGETLQNVTPIPFGTDWTEPTSGLTTTGKAVPISNTLQQLGGYIIRFQYFKNRLNITQTTQTLQVPDDYVDIVIQGVQALAWKLLGKNQEAQDCFQLFKAGLGEMVMDKNLFPEGQEFIRPDSGSFVNQQILGYLPPYF